MPTTDDSLGSVPAPAPAPAQPPVSPGKSASEFIATALAIGGPIAAAIVDMLLKSGKVQEGTPWYSVLMVLAAVLAALGYTAARSAVKIAHQLAAGNAVAAVMNRDAEYAKLQTARLQRQIDLSGTE